MITYMQNCRSLNFGIKQEHRYAYCNLQFFIFSLRKKNSLKVYAIKCLLKLIEMIVHFHMSREVSWSLILSKIFGSGILPILLVEAEYGSEILLILLARSEISYRIGT